MTLYQALMALGAWSPECGQKKHWKEFQEAFAPVRF